MCEDHLMVGLRTFDAVRWMVFAHLIVTRRVSSVGVRDKTQLSAYYQLYYQLYFQLYFQVLVYFQLNWKYQCYQFFQLNSSCNSSGPSRPCCKMSKSIKKNSIAKIRFSRRNKMKFETFEIRKLQIRKLQIRKTYAERKLFICDYAPSNHSM